MFGQAGRMLGIFLCLPLGSILVTSIQAGGNLDTESASSRSREERLLSLFQVIRFSNQVCNGGDNSEVGTCYTNSECTARNGIAIGTCAQGFGVCCKFSMTCGGTTNENCTFFESSTLTSPRECTGVVCPCSQDIRQMRLDFIRFNLEGPLETNEVSARVLNASPTHNDEGIAVSSQSQCVVDRFVVLNSGRFTPPVICGTNTGEHMYFDVSGTECTSLSAFIGTCSSVRNFKIKITQYSGEFANLAPPGCTQYFFGQSGQGIVKTYNFEGGAHLANQQQTICIRREANACRICWWIRQMSDFSVTGHESHGMGSNENDFCCGSGRMSSDTAGQNTQGNDCVSIPGASRFDGGRTNSRFCGRSSLFAQDTNDFLPRIGEISSGGADPDVDNDSHTSEDPMLGHTICSMMAPFRIVFRSDQFEVVHTKEDDLRESRVVTTIDRGFRLSYALKPCVSTRNLINTSSIRRKHRQESSLFNFWTLMKRFV